MIENLEIPIKLTEYSHGAGCGCKISPALLDQILKHPKNSLAPPPFPGLLVGNAEKDDAAAFDLGDGQALVSTTDFFMPIVDDPFQFGRIASVNAISDVYAMGAKPLMAIAILGWPINKLPAEVAAKVLEGARFACQEASIPLAGGHSIDSPEPIFGLSVNGLIPVQNIKRNHTAREGSLIYLTKKLGVGILSTAQKKNILSMADAETAIQSMTTLNKLGEKLGAQAYVSAMTDVTGFGLLGHLLEMCEGSHLHAELHFADVPQMEHLDHYLAKGCYPGGTLRNWSSYGDKISPITEQQKFILADPQTSGGLLIAVDPPYQAIFEAFAAQNGVPGLRPIGILTAENKAHRITVC